VCYFALRFFLKGLDDLPPGVCFASRLTGWNFLTTLMVFRKRHMASQRGG